jgi:cytochrome P450
MRELITVLHTLLREGEFSAVDETPERIVRRSIMLAPRRGTRVRFRPLEPDGASAPPPDSRDP